MSSTTNSPLSSPGSALSPDATTIGENVVGAVLPPPVVPLTNATERLRELDISPSSLVDEDQEMTDVPPGAEFTTPVAPEASSNSSVATSSAPSLKEVLKKTLVKKEKVQRDYLIAMNSEAPEDASKADELREALSNLEKHVKALTSGMKVHRVPNSGLKISKRDLPKFQFEDSKMKPFPNEDAYKSVDHFLSEFEKIVHSSGQEIQDVWKKYIPLTLPFDLDDWLQNIVLKAATWADVKSTFHKKFGTTISKLHKRRAVMTMTIGEDETVDEYASRFFRTVGEAGYHRDDLTIGDIFLLGLPEEWQFNLSTVLLSRTKREAWTSSEILDFATNLMGERTPNTYFASRKGDDVSGNRKRKVPVTTGVAAVSNAAGLSAALENGLPKARMLGDKNQPNRAAKTAVPCRHCGRAWRHGHTCEEYRAQKRQKNASVLSVASTSKGEENEAVEPVNYYKEQYENEIYK
ncbi:unnamed protein product [Mucor circinelloides]